MEPVLCVIRHGRTIFNTENVFRDSREDVPLSRDGVGDALEAKEFLEEFDPSFYVSSDRKRARQMAHIVAGEHVDDIVTSHNLTAWDIGNFAGKPRDEKNLAKLKMYVDNPSLAIPGGESLDDFRDRVLPTKNECFEYACHSGLGFMICHSSVIHELGNAIYNDHNSLVVEPGGVVILGFEDGKPTARPVFKLPTQNL